MSTADGPDGTEVLGGKRAPLCKRGRCDRGTDRSWLRCAKRVKIGCGVQVASCRMVKSKAGLGGCFMIRTGGC